jgi:hypothetical protein
MGKHARGVPAVYRSDSSIATAFHAAETQSTRNDAQIQGHISPRITVFTSDKAPLTKRFTLRDGAIHKETHATLYAGMAETIEAPTARALSEILDGLQPGQAIATGQLKHAPQARIATRNKMHGAEVARSLDHFEFATGAGWLLWDYDAKTMPPEVAARVADLGGPIAALFHIWPEAQAGAYLIRPSSSDGIFVPGLPPTQSAGLHGFFLVSDVARSADILKTLEARAWIEGLAWIALSKSGATLARSIVDTAVGSPERLIFEAPPILTAPLTRIKRAPIVKDDGQPLEAPDSPLEAAAEAQRIARALIAPEAQKQEAAFVEARARIEAKKTGKSLRIARQSIRRMMTGGILTDDHLLQLASGQWARAGELLDSPKNHRLSLPDPIEGLDYGRDKATLFLTPRAGFPDEKPRLISHAHGQRTVYTFARYETPPRGKAPLIEPYHPATTGDRDATITKHPEVVTAWADRSIRTMQAAKHVARGYAEIDQPDPEDPERDDKLKAIKRTQHAIRKQARDLFGLDHLPASEITKATPISRVMLTGAQGVGKTSALVGRKGTPGALHKAHGVVSILFEPDHAKAAEVLADYDANAPANAPPAILLRGRSAQDPDQPEGTTMCHLPDIAGKLAARGVSVPKTLCERCPFADRCGYLKQENKIKALAVAPEGVVIFAAHDYAFLPLPGLIEPDMAIFDERPRDMGVTEASVSFEMLTEGLRFDRPLQAQHGAQTVSEQADAEALNLQFIKPLMIALRNAGQDHSERMLSALRDSGIDRSRVVGAIAGLAYFMDRETGHACRQAIAEWGFAGLSGSATSLNKRLSAAIDQREAKIATALQTIFKALLIEIDMPRADAVAIGVGEVERRPGSSDKAQGLVAVVLKPLRAGRVPFLHLDGTGDHGMSERLFGPMQIEHHPVERTQPGRGDKITQVVGASFHTGGLIGGRKGKGDRVPYTGGWKQSYDTQRDDIRKIIAGKPGALVVANKAAIETLKPEELGTISAHFGALRGRNTWEDRTKVLIVGRDQPAPAAVERIARAYAARDPAPFERLNPKVPEYPEQERGIRTRDGAGRAIAVAYHPNAWADRVLRQIRDAEIEQAIDRIRPIFKDEPIEIVVMSPVALNLTVDHVTEWKDYRKGGSRVERALDQARVIPLSAREAARLLPDIWGGTTTAERDFEGEGLSPHSLNRTFYLQFGAVRNFTIATYRAVARAGQRAHEHKALIAAPPAEARAVLEALTGPLRDFEVIEGVEQATAAPNPAPLPYKTPAPTPERATQRHNVVSLPDTRQDAEKPPQRLVRAGGGP